MKQVELFEAVREGLTPEAKRLLDKFEVVTGAPGGGKRLRDLMLELAVRGRLVSQVADDEAATALLARMGHARNHDSGISGSVSLFSIPRSWDWCSLVDLIDPERKITYGVLVPGADTDEGVPFVRIQDLSVRNQAPLPNKRIAASVEAPYARSRLLGGELLLGVVGSIGKVGVAPATWGGANIARAVCRLQPHPLLGSEFLALVLQSAFVQGYFRDSTRTLAQPTLNVSMIRATPIPLPPLAEQKRIVAKVDALMKLCDDLEARQAKQREVAGRLSKAALDALASAEGPEELAASWQRVTGSFNRLASRPEDLNEWRNAILRLGATGSLVNEVCANEDGSTVDSYVSFLNGYAFKSEWFVPEGVRLLRNANVSHGYMRWEDVARVSPSKADEFERFALGEGDIVVTLDRPIIATGVKVARVAREDFALPFAATRSEDRANERTCAVVRLPLLVADFAVLRGRD